MAPFLAHTKRKPKSTRLSFPQEGKKSSHQMTTDGRWFEGYRRYNAKVKAGRKETSLWERPYEERRTCSKEERVVRQVAVESTWKNTPLEGVWGLLRSFATPADDYQMNKSKLISFMRSVGVMAPRFREDLSDLFMANLSKYNIADCAPGCINAMHLCKALEMCFAEQSFRDVLIPHCFTDLMTILSEGRDPVDSAAKEDVEGCIERMMQDFSSQTEEQRERHLKAIERLMAVEELMNSSECAKLDFASFTTLFFSPGSGYLVVTFLKHTLEVCARQLKPPFGSFPVLSLRWVNSTVPVPYNVHCPSDADALLLKLHEQHESHRAASAGKKAGARSAKRKAA